MTTFRVETSARVLYMDTDQMGVVNHAVALRWFEQARAEWFRNRGRTYRALEEEGVQLPVYQLAVRYHQPARYDEVLDLAVRLLPPGSVRVTFEYRVQRQGDGAVLLAGMTQHACMGRDGRATRIPRDLARVLGEHASPPEAEPAFTLK